MKRFITLVVLLSGISVLHADSDMNAFTVTGKIYVPDNLQKIGNVTNITEVTFYRTQDQWKILSIPVKKLFPCSLCQLVQRNMGWLT